jgi:acetyltransferase
VHGPAWSAGPPVARERLALRDGRGVWVRPVHAGDAAAERAFFAALSPNSRRRRFHGAMAQLPMPVARAMTQVDFRHHVALVAEAGAADGAARLVADARYVRADADAGVAEFAIAVADDWQGIGLGRALLQRLGRHARLSGICTLTGSVLADNLPMLALMQDVGASRHEDPEDAGLVRIVVRL